MSARLDGDERLQKKQVRLHASRVFGKTTANEFFAKDRVNMAWNPGYSGCVSYSMGLNNEMSEQCQVSHYLHLDLAM